MAIEAGARFGPYEVRSRLGAGGMGEVFAAVDTRLGRAVALKVLLEHVARDADHLRRFEQEARTAGSLNHPNICSVFDIGSDSAGPFVVYELLDGQTLRSRLARGPLPESSAISIGSQIARGLAAAHAKGIIHRDLKPENIFVTSDGTAKILDFGLARISTRAEFDIRDPEHLPTLTLATEPGIILGTFRYMSPEQVRGHPVDYRSDLFSFGIVLFEMLTGSPPFEKPSAIETMNAILNEEPPFVGRRMPHISPALERIVSHCLEKASDQRFQSARDLVFSLESTGTGTETSAARTGRAEMPPGWGRRAIRWLPTVGVGAAAFAAAWLLKPTVDKPGAPTFSRAVRFVATDALECAPAISPDAKWLAYLSDAGGRTNVWVKFIAGGEPVNLTTAAGLWLTARRDGGGLEISPDGNSVVFDAEPQDNAGKVSTYVIPAPLGGVPRKLIEGGAALRFSPDGRRLVYMRPGFSAGDSLFVADADGQSPREILQARNGLHAHWLSWSADSKYVYFNYGISVRNAEPTEIYRVAVAGGAPEPVIATSRRAVFPSPTADGRGLVYAANPSSFELSLWWKGFDNQSQRLTTGLGEYAEPRLSADGHEMVATIYDLRQSLARIPLAFGETVRPTLLGGVPSGDFDPSLSPEGDRLVFSSTRSGGRNLWLARPDGSDPRPLTSGATIDERPAFSPDGSQVAFVSSRAAERAIWVVSADGGTPRRVTAAQVLDTLTWSPDGRRILFAGPAGDTAGLWQVAAAGGQPTRLPTPGPAHSPNWSKVRDVITYLEPIGPTPGSPPSSRVAFIRPDGQPAFNSLPKGPGFWNGAVTWSRDGRYVAAVADAGAAFSEVWVVEPEGRQPFRLLTRLPIGQRPRGITWSSDGSALIFGREERTADIVLFDQGEDHRH